MLTLKNMRFRLGIELYSNHCYCKLVKVNEVKKWKTTCT